MCSVRNFRNFVACPSGLLTGGCMASLRPNLLTLFANFTYPQNSPECWTKYLKANSLRELRGEYDGESEKAEC